MKHLLALKPYLYKYRWWLVAGCICLFLANRFNLLIPRFVGKAIDAIQFQQATSRFLFSVVLIILGLAVAQGIFRFLMRRLLIGVSRHFEYEFRNNYYRHLLSLSPSFYDNNKTGDLMSRATTDIEAVRMLLGPGLLNLVNSATIFPLAIYQMLTINSTLTLISILPLLSVPILAKIFGSRIYRYHLQVQENFADISALAQETFAGIRVIKAFCREPSLNRLFARLNDAFLRSNLQLVKTSALLFPALRSIAALALLIVIVIGGKYAIQGKGVSIGDITAFVLIHIQLFWPLIAIGWIINIFQRAAGSMARLQAILQTQPEITDSERPAAITELKGKIQCQDLTFSYGNSPVLKDINLEISPGDVIGIIGPVGSGKSTLVFLLLRLYDPTSGSILIDDVNIKNIPLAILRSQIALVFQDSFIFSDTIAKNIIFGRDFITEEKMKWAAEMSCFSADVAEFPEGYNTLVGERGVSLSGGQRQRLALARALAGEPKILILDDAFSSVDTETEQKILRNLQTLIPNMTIIIISHRVSTLQLAQRIYVLDEGRITESGTQQELIEKDGLYAEIVRQQMLEEKL